MGTVTWSLHKPRPGSSFPGRMFSTVRKKIQMQGGNERVPCSGDTVGWAAGGNCRVSGSSPDGVPGVPGLMAVVSVLQLTAGTGRTGNQLSTTDTPWLPKSSSKMWLKLSTNMPLSRMSMYPACQFESQGYEWECTGCEDLTCSRIPNRIWSCFLGGNPSDPSERNTKASWVGTFCSEVRSWLYLFVQHLRNNRFCQWMFLVKGWPLNHVSLFMCTLVLPRLHLGAPGIGNESGNKESKDTAAQLWTQQTIQEKEVVFPTGTLLKKSVLFMGSSIYLGSYCSPPPHTVKMCVPTFGFF